jgi:hypothetical protein
MNTPKSANRQIVDLRAEVKRLQAENERLKADYASLCGGNKWLLSENQRIQIEIAKLQVQLAATEEALAQVQQESDKLRKEYSWLCQYPGPAAMAVCEAAIAHSIASSAESKLTRMTPPDWRDQDLRVSMIHACHLLMNAEAEAQKALSVAVDNYRAEVKRIDTAPERLKERIRDAFKTLPPANPILERKARLESSDSCDLGHDNPNMRDKDAVLLKDAVALSREKQAAVDRGIEGAEKIETMHDTN